MFKIGDKVVDTWYELVWGIGIVRSVSKGGRIKISFVSPPYFADEDGTVTYDKAHAKRFLKVLS